MQFAFCDRTKLIMHGKENNVFHIHGSDKLNV